MEIVNLFEFLNMAKSIHSLDYAMCDDKLANYLEIINIESSYTNRIDFGVMYFALSGEDKYYVIDGINRLLSLSLMLHAVCECYKRTSEKNDKAIQTIRSKYLVDEKTAKLKLPTLKQIIYEKILFGEKLSGKEKNSPMFKLLHEIWVQIKENKIPAGQIFDALSKINITYIECSELPHRELYYSINKYNQKMNHLLLIEDYLKEFEMSEAWNDICKVFDFNEDDIYLFFKDFFVRKTNYKDIDMNNFYEIFVNYFESTCNSMPLETIISRLKRSAVFYKELLTVTVKNEAVKKQLIQIKLHNGDDTYAYLLNVYEEYMDGIITEDTLLEILTAIDNYLQDREKNPSDVIFNELIQKLNNIFVNNC